MDGYGVDLILERISGYIADGKRVFATSSFQSQSLPLLHILSLCDKKIPIYYTNTGYLFPKTLMFADYLKSSLGLNIIGLDPLVPKNRQLDRNGRLMFASDPDYCCYLNKVQPLDPILREYDVWINGIRADQSATRSQMSEEQPAPHGCTRYHPMLNWTSKMVHYYCKENSLPAHPMEEEGYLSIGCEPCTAKYIEGNERNARWFGMNKSECGLHTDLIAKD